MNEEFLAEFLLSLTSPVESARATVGDFMEQAELRGPVWFWTSILHTAGSQTWSHWIKAPVQLAAAAFFLWLQLIFGSLVFALVAYLAWLVIYLADNHTGLELLTTSWGTRVPLVPPSWLAYWVGVGVLPTAAAWFRGAETAQQSRGYELPLWIAVAMVWTFLGISTKLPLVTLIAPPLAFVGGMLRTRRRVTPG